MTAEELLNQTCVEYAPGTPPLGEADIERYQAAVPGWSLEEGVLRRKLMFNDFVSLIGFVNRLAEAAEVDQHHPDFLVYGYKRMRIDFATHSIGGLSLNDFIMAAKVNRLLDSEDVREADR
jgi:4a-hydroxytetrahydrobiopterin dehydratase